MNKWKSQKQTQQRHQNQVKANFARAQKKKKSGESQKKCANNKQQLKSSTSKNNRWYNGTFVAILRIRFIYWNFYLPFDKRARVLVCVWESVSPQKIVVRTNCGMRQINTRTAIRQWTTVSNGIMATTVKLVFSRIELAFPSFLSFFTCCSSLLLLLWLLLLGVPGRYATIVANINLCALKANCGVVGGVVVLSNQLYHRVHRSHRHPWEAAKRTDGVAAAGRILFHTYECNEKVILQVALNWNNKAMP